MEQKAQAVPLITVHQTAVSGPAIPTLNAYNKVKSRRRSVGPLSPRETSLSAPLSSTTSGSKNKDNNTLAIKALTSPRDAHRLVSSADSSPSSTSPNSNNKRRTSDGGGGQKNKPKAIEHFRQYIDKSFHEREVEDEQKRRRKAMKERERLQTAREAKLERDREKALEREREMAKWEQGKEDWMRGANDAPLNRSSTKTKRRNWMMDWEKQWKKKWDASQVEREEEAEREGEKKALVAYAVIDLYGKDRLRLYDFPIDMVAVVKAALTLIWHDEGLLYLKPKTSTCWEFRLANNPWQELSSVPVCRLQLAVLSLLCTIGWHVSVTLKRKNAWILEQRSGTKARLFAMTIASSSTLRLVDVPPRILAALRRGMLAAWTKGIESEQQIAVSCWDYEFKGEPWTKEEEPIEDTVASRRLMCNLLAVLQRKGWGLYATLSDTTWIFINTSEVQLEEKELEKEKEIEQQLEREKEKEREEREKEKEKERAEREKREKPSKEKLKRLEEARAAMQEDSEHETDDEDT